MRGTNYLLAVTTTSDEVTNEVKPLFAFPVQVCKALSDDDVKFDIAAPSGAPRKQAWIDTATGELVENDDCLKGIRLSDDDFRPIPKDTIDAINAETKITTMVALGSTPLAGLREKYGDRITGRYFVQNPTKGGSAKAYRITYEALLAEKAAMIVKRTKSTKQALAFIYADAENGCLVMCEVAFAAAVRPADDQLRAPLTADVEKKMIDNARKILKAMPDGTQALDAEVDEAQAMKQALIEQAVAGEAINVPAPIAATVENDDLEAALLASIG